MVGDGLVPSGAESVGALNTGGDKPRPYASLAESVGAFNAGGDKPRPYASGAEFIDAFNAGICFAA